MENSMRFIVVGLFVLLFSLQYKLWFGEGSFTRWLTLEKKLDEQSQKNEQLSRYNQVIAADIAELKSGDQALEERARYDLGMVKEDEVYYQFVE